MPQQSVQEDPRFTPDIQEDERFIPDEPEPSLGKRVWDFATTPITTIPSDIGKSIADWYTEPTLANSPTGEGGLYDRLAILSAQARGFLGGAVEGVGNLASEMTSPLNLATMGAFGGESAAIRRGLPEVGKALKWTGKGLSAPFAYQGGSKVIDPESSLSERGMGLAELAGGMAGMLHPGVGPRRGPAPPQMPAIEPEMPLRPPVAPQVAEPVAGRPAPNIKGFEDVSGPTGLQANLTTVEGIQQAFKAGKISRDNALKLMQKIHREELKAAQAAKPIERVDPETGEVTEVYPENPAAPKPATKVQEIVDSIESGEVKNVAELQGKLGISFNETKVLWYEAKERIRAAKEAAVSTVQETVKPLSEKTVAVSMGDRGTWISPGTKAEYEYLTNIKRAQEGKPPLEGSMELTDAQKSEFHNKFFKRQQIPGEAPPPVEPIPVQTEGLTYLIKQGDASAELVKKARDQGYKFVGLNDRGDFKFKKTDPNIPDIPPTGPLNQLPTPKGLGDVIKAIPRDTGDEVLNSMVASLRAMRRRKGIEPFNPRETNAYNGLMTQIQNHPALPPELKAKWDKIVPSAKEGMIHRLIKNEKGELVIRQEKENVSWEPKDPSPLFPGLTNLEADEFSRIIQSQATGNFLGGKAKQVRGNELAAKITDKNLVPPDFITRLKSEKGELVVHREMGKPGDVPIGRVVIVATKKATPSYLKNLMNEGFEFIGENDRGQLRFRKTKERAETPLLEEDVLPTKKEKGKPDTEIGMPRQIYDLSRGLMSVDPPFVTSAAFRQAMPWVGTKNWFKSWKSAAQAFGEKAWYDARMKQIQESPLFKERKLPDGKIAKSFAEEIGIRMTDLKDTRSTRMEGIKSQLAERLPGVGRYVAASNRAFSAFLNDLRFSQLEAFVKDSKILAKVHNDPKLDLTLNIPLAKEYAQFLNDTTGAATLKTGIGSHQYSLEMHAQKLADVFFSPRLMASRIRMLNLSTYVMANPAVRKQYVHAMLRTVAAWWGMAQLAKMAGAEVSTDPNNPDFGKIKIGDTRLDPGAGFQQFLVLGSRIKPDSWHLPIEPTDTGIMPLDLATGYLGTPGGQYASSISNESRPFGVGLNPPTRTSSIIDFFANKLHPTAKLIYDIGDADERRPVYMADRIMQLYVPMMAGDLAQLAMENPELIPLVLPATGVGMGSQTYTGAPVTPSFTPLLGLDKYDIQFGGKK